MCACVHELCVDAAGGRRSVTGSLVELVRSGYELAADDGPPGTRPLVEENFYLSRALDRLGRDARCSHGWNVLFLCVSPLVSPFA